MAQLKLNTNHHPALLTDSSLHTVIENSFSENRYFFWYLHKAQKDRETK